MTDTVIDVGGSPTEPPTSSTTAKRKRDYPAERAVKSMKRSNIPGVQGFNLKNGMQELVQKERNQDQLREEGTTAEEDEKLELQRLCSSYYVRDPSLGCGNSSFIKGRIFGIILQELNASLEAASWAVRVRAPSVFEAPSKFMSLVLASALISQRDKNFDSHALQMTGMLEKIEITLQILPSDCPIMRDDFKKLRTALQTIIRLARFENVASIEALERAGECTQHEIGLIQNIAKLAAEADLSHRFDQSQEKLKKKILSNNRNVLDGVLSKENEILQAYKTHEHDDLRAKHRDFVSLCGSLLHEAQLRHSKGDSSLLDLLLEHRVPEKWWKTGWQRYLDHLYDTNQVEAMDCYLQEAYTEVVRLRDEAPSLRDHWEQCLKGLDRYSNKIHERKLALRKAVEADDDDGGGIATVDFAGHWDKPLSAIASTVLRGWSIIGRTVAVTVYLRLGLVFCQIDRP